MMDTSSKFPPTPPTLVGIGLDDLAQALAGGNLTSTELVAKYLHRIGRYDRSGLCLNSIPLLNPAVFDEAAASDDRRAAGLPVRPLEGIPFTVKDNIAVAGMTAAAGSPAFAELRPKHSAFVVDQLRQAGGAVLVGKTNMPPMARGGMQRGVYGRAESPYNSAYLTAAFGSGSSNGSATSTTAGFAAFGLGTETVSSGRSPASNNALVAYTPSRGRVSLQGVWPLYASCDVLTPHTTSMDDLYRILPFLTAPDPSSDCDFWRKQKYVSLPPMAAMELPKERQVESLTGKRIGVPKMYIGKTDTAAAKDPAVAASILELWERARRDLEAMGATVVETDFPVVSSYEANNKLGLQQGLPGCPPGWTDFEQEDILALTWQQYLDWAEDPDFTKLEDVDPDLIFPQPADYLPLAFDSVRHMAYRDLIQIPHKKSAKDMFGGIDVKQGLSALEQMRQTGLEDWMDDRKLDFVVFPANADVARSDMETNRESAQAGLLNGVKFSHGNRVLRHLGIPTVSVSMGVMRDTRMPVNLTFAGKAYADADLLAYAHAYEQHTHRRVSPPLTPPLSTDSLPPPAALSSTGHVPITKRRVAVDIALCTRVPTTIADTAGGDTGWTLHIAGVTRVAFPPESASMIEDAQIDIFVNGTQVDSRTVRSDAAGHWEASISGLSSRCLGHALHQHLRTMVVVLARHPAFRPSGALRMLD